MINFFIRFIEIFNDFLRFMYEGHAFRPKMLTPVPETPPLTWIKADGLDPGQKHTSNSFFHEEAMDNGSIAYLALVVCAFLAFSLSLSIVSRR